jgi:hypothetical protein
MAGDHLIALIGPGKGPVIRWSRKGRVFLRTKGLLDGAAFAHLHLGEVKCRVVLDVNGDVEVTECYAVEVEYEGKSRGAVFSVLVRPYDALRTA